MDINSIRKKFGDDYIANEKTFLMGSDIRFSSHIAERFTDLTVLESCTGAGFATISLAKIAKHIITVEIDKIHQQQAIKNVETAKLSNKVTFIHGNVLDKTILDKLRSVDAAFLDPDWAVTDSQHKYRFLNSNTQPPADTLLEKIFELTENIALILPPFIDVNEFINLPAHEKEELYIGDSHELICLYFGKLMKSNNVTEFHVPV